MEGQGAGGIGRRGEPVSLDFTGGGNSVEFPSAWPWGALEPRAYSLIVVDPPWTFRTYSPKGWGKSAQNHYGCMTMADIAALPVRDLAAADCMVWCWATAPLLDQQIAILKGWGARYVTNLTWVKTTATGKLAFGTGYVARNAHEIVLLGAFGRPKIGSRSIRSVFMAPVREHSRKPEAAYDLARQMVPTGRYADLFSRAHRPGFEAWGHEVGKFDEVAA